MLTLKVMWWAAVPSRVMFGEEKAEQSGIEIGHVESTQWISNITGCTRIMQGTLDMIERYAEEFGLFTSEAPYTLIGSGCTEARLGEGGVSPTPETLHTLLELERPSGREYVVVNKAFLMSETGATIDRVAP